MIKDVIDIIIKYSRSPKFYMFIISSCLVIFTFWSFIYANLFYYSRMHNRVEILSMLSEIDYEKISSNEILRSEFHAILYEIEVQRTILVSIGNFNLTNDIIS